MSDLSANGRSRPFARRSAMALLAAAALAACWLLGNVQTGFGRRAYGGGGGRGGTRAAPDQPPSAARPLQPHDVRQSSVPAEPTASDDRGFGRRLHGPFPETLRSQASS